MKLCYSCMNTIEDRYNTVCPLCGMNIVPVYKENLYLKPGTVLTGKFVVGRVIGHGGFGITYLGWHNVLKCKIAIKEFYPQDIPVRNEDGVSISIPSMDKKGKFESGLDRFIKEAQDIAGLQDIVGVTQIFSFFKANGTGYIIFEFLDGQTLKEYMKRIGQENKAMEYSLAREYVLNVLFILKQVHARGIIHRDIAPDNVFLTNEGNIKLIDFGAAKTETSILVEDNAILVKSGYTPPEQYSNKVKHTPATDLYAVASMFYYLLTGKRVSPAIERMMNDDLIPLSQRGVHIPSNAEAAILMCLDLNQKYRLQSAEDFMEALGDRDFIPRDKMIWEGTIPNELPESEKNKFSNFSKKKKIVVISSAVGGATVLIVAGAILLNQLNKNAKQAVTVTKSSEKFEMSKDISLEDFEEKWTEDYGFDLSTVHYIYRYDSEEAKEGNETVKEIEYNSEILDDGKDISKIQEELKKASFNATDNPLITIEVAGSMFTMKDDWLYSYNESGLNKGINYLDDLPAINPVKGSEDIPYGKVVDITVEGDSIAKTKGDAYNSLSYNIDESNRESGAFTINDDTEWVLDTSKNVEITIGNGDYFWMKKNNNKGDKFKNKYSSDITFNYGKEDGYDIRRAIGLKETGYIEQDYFSFDGKKSFLLISTIKPFLPSNEK